MSNTAGKAAIQRRRGFCKHKIGLLSYVRLCPKFDVLELMTTLPFTVCAGKGSSSLLHFERYRNEIDGLGGERWAITQHDSLKPFQHTPLDL